LSYTYYSIYISEWQLHESIPRAPISFSGTEGLGQTLIKFQDETLEEAKMVMRIAVRSIIVRISSWLIVPVLFSASCHTWAVENNAAQERAQPGSRLQNEQAVLLDAHEPNRVGFTKDSDDKLFMDFLISMQHPIAFNYFKNNFDASLPYFAFTGRFGQYITTRDSSPVIAKKFNPKFFLRHFLDGGTISNKDNPDASYIDFEYAHESNGQSVDSLQSYNAAANSPGNNPDFAKDYLSRGWDYLGLSGKHSHVVDGWTMGYAFRKYLNRGWIFQEQIEQYMPWEGARSITKINQVSGIRLHAKKTIKKAFLDDIAVNLETGNSQPFKYTTVDVELGITPFRHFLGMPVVLWAKTGYNSDLAQYYKKVTSVGAALRFETFQRGSIPASAR